MVDKKIYINNGSAVVQVGAGLLSALGDVTLTSLTSGQTISWNGTAWVNSTGSNGGVTSFNTRTGAVTLSSADVTTALGFTPYNSTNPSGYITASASITGNAANVTGTVAIANGGTGATTAANARTNLGLSYSSGGSAGVSLINSDGTHEISRYIDFHNAGGDAVDFTVRLDGGGVGSTTLSLSGNFTASGNVTAYSDERLKKDWSDLPEDFVENLAKTKSGLYTRIDTGDRQVGSSAQDWKQLLPEVVSEADDEIKTLSLAYGNAALVSAIELAKRVVKLEAILAELLKGKL